MKPATDRGRINFEKRRAEQEAHGKACRHCKAHKPIEAYYWRAPTGKQKSAVYSANCRDCTHALRRGDLARKAKLKHKYGMSVEAFNALLAEQNGGCKICGCSPEESTNGTLNVDHDHTTGKVRGLLCLHCNSGLGMFRDNKNTLLSAAVYLENC